MSTVATTETPRYTDEDREAFEELCGVISESCQQINTPENQKADRISASLLGRDLHVSFANEGTLQEAVTFQDGKRSYRLPGRSLRQCLLSGSAFTTRALAKFLVQRNDSQQNVLTPAERREQASAEMREIFAESGLHKETVEEIITELNNNRGYGKFHWGVTGAKMIARLAAKLDGKLFDEASLINLERFRQAKGMWKTLFPSDYSPAAKTIPFSMFKAAKGVNSLVFEVSNIVESVIEVDIEINGEPEGDFVPANVCTYIIDVLISHAINAGAKIGASAPPAPEKPKKSKKKIKHHAIDAESDPRTQGFGKLSEFSELDKLNIPAEGDLVEAV